MPPRSNVNFSQDPIKFWYHMLWRHKESFHFYEIKDSFVKEFRCMLIGMEADRLTEVVVKFLFRKGVYIFKEKFNAFLVFKGNPFSFPVLCGRFFD